MLLSELVALLGRGSTSALSRRSEVSRVTILKIRNGAAITNYAVARRLSNATRYVKDRSSGELVYSERADPLVSVSEILEPQLRASKRRRRRAA